MFEGGIRIQLWNRKNVSWNYSLSKSSLSVAKVFVSKCDMQVTKLILNCMNINIHCYASTVLCYWTINPWISQSIRDDYCWQAALPQKSCWLLDYWTFWIPPYLLRYAIWFLSWSWVNSATLKVINDIITGIDKRQYCAAIFIDLAKAFDSVNHHTLICSSTALDSQMTPSTASPTTSQTVQCVKSDGLLSGPLAVSMGVPQG